MKREAGVVGVLIALGCGGAGGGMENSPTLSGTLNVVDFSIPAGQSRTASGNVVIVASKSISIAGTLNIPAGASVSLFAAEDVSLNGTIRGQGASGQSRGIGRLNSLLAAGKNVRSGGGHSLGEGANAMFATTGAGTVTITGPITLPAGRDARGSGEFGANGGAILIGTPEVIAYGVELGRAIQAPGTVTLSAPLTAGAGGAGYDDTRGISVGDDVVGEGTRGGQGGDVAIQCGILNFQGSAKLVPGAGGRGGWVGRTPTSNTYLAGRDQTVRGKNGGSATATPGAGGPAGLRKVTATQVNGSVNSEVVLGGACGQVFIQGGNAGPVAAGGAGKVNLPDRALNSDNTKRPPGGTIEFRGGHGGVGDASGTGGVGGNLSINLSSLTQESPLSQIVIDDAQRGGNGFDGCTANPQRAGTAGGPGGTIERSFANVQTKGRAGNGGDGGNTLTGAGPAGGTKGTVGRDGLPGRSCAEAGRVMVLARDFPLKDGLVLVAGTHISVSRIRGGHVGHPEEGCSTEHIHGAITIDGYGLIEDPDPDGCGHGPLLP